MPARIRCNIIIVRVLPGISDAEGVLAAKQVKDLGDVALQALGLGVVRFGKAKALGIECSTLERLAVDLCIVHNLGDVEERLLMEVVPAPSECAVHEEARAKGTVIAHGPVPRAIIP